jgi:uncharacterized membrane protein
VGLDGTGYQLLLVLHLLAVIAAFGPMLLYPRLRREAPGVIRPLHDRLVLPALVLLWVFGMGLVGLSDDAWELSDTWIALSLVLWLVALGLAFFVQRPALAAGGRDAAAQSRLAASTGVIHLILVVVVYLMVFKPGA